MTSGPSTAPVAVFDSGLPAGLAFIRSLGRAGVPVWAYDDGGWTAGRHSRWAVRGSLSPNTENIEPFLDWWRAETERHGPALVAPSSDQVAFLATEFERRSADPDPSADHHGDMISDCLFKPRFAQLMEKVGFPVPAWALPGSLDQALDAAEEIGYPVVFKPRSHVGLGVGRGEVAADADQLRSVFGPWTLVDGADPALVQDPDLHYPIMQQMVTGDRVEVVSVAGYVDRDGQLHGVEAVTKTSQWGGPLTIGTEFEVVPWSDPFDHAMEILPQVLRSALFEFELLIDRATGRYWAIELNPRAFGQLSLSIARGNDLPRYWYRDITGIELPPVPPPRRPPRRWRMGTPYWAGRSVQAVRGPGRLDVARELATAPFRPTASSIHSWRDPAPGLAFTLGVLAHPGGLFRPYLGR